MDGDERGRALDRLVAEVRASAKYRSVEEGLIRSIGGQELQRRRGLKEALKATRSRLHQVGGAYLGRRIEYEAMLAALREASGDSATLRDRCRAIMARHASTRERLAILDRFYETILDGIGPVRSVLDLACGLGPLAIPWMPLEEGCIYQVYDIYEDLIVFLAGALPILGVSGTAHVMDLTRSLPNEQVDIALLLKCIPCLEQLDRSVGRRLLRSIPARYLVVSFPVQSLGGRGKGMVDSYDAHLRRLVADQPWSVQRFDFSTELAYRIDTHAAQPIASLG